MRTARRLILFALGAAGIAALTLVQRGAAGLPRGLPAAGSTPVAPELDGAVAWLNTDHPIRLSELRGRVVILDFWTYGCINCIHVLPVLRELEATRQGQPLEVIGVHSAKFDNEKAPERVRAAVERYGLTHPVAVDSAMAIWDRYGVQAWPTLVVIDPEGRIASTLSGEVTFKPLDELVGKLMAEARGRGKLASGPALARHRPAVDSGELADPGKVISAPDGRLFVADSRHHRVLITTAGGRILDQIGSGQQGHRDGSFETARLDDPQGMALTGHTLYLADARGYVVLQADLSRRQISTIAGTGELGSRPLGAPVKATAFALRSPWDVALQGSRLFVAMAGSHQIGVIDLTRGTLAAAAGDGREDLRDGAADEASFAQPSGLSLSADGKTLFVADSESSGVRALDLTTRQTRTLLGTGLFAWGDGEGALRPKLLQHPLAVAASAGGLWVADSYNGKIKRFTPDERKLRTVVAMAAGKPLSDPGGLWVEPDGALLITDTGNHRLLRLPPGASAPLVVPIGHRPEPAQVADTPSDASSRLAVTSTQLAPQTLSVGEQRLPLALVAPADYAFSDGAPWSIELGASGGNVKLGNAQLNGEATAGGRIEFETSADVREGQGEISAAVHANLCEALKHAACYPVRAHFTIPVEGSASGANAQAALVLALPAPLSAGSAHSRPTEP